MADNLVFSDAAAKEISKQLSSAITTVGGLNPTDPASYDLGDDSVAGAAETVFVGLKVYAGNVLTGTKNVKTLVDSAGDSIAAFDQNLKLLAAATPAAPGKKNPVKHGGDPNAPRLKITDEDGQGAKTSHKTEVYGRNGSHSSSTETNHYTGNSTTTTTDHSNITGNTTKNETTTYADGSTDTTVTGTDRDGNKTVNHVSTDARGRRTDRRGDNSAGGN